MNNQSWVAREVDLLLNEHEADGSRSDQEIVQDLKHFVHCSKELVKRDPTLRENLYLSYLQMLWQVAGFTGPFDFLKLEAKIIELVESEIKMPEPLVEHKSGLFGHLPTLTLQTPDWADGYNEALTDVKLLNEV